MDRNGNGNGRRVGQAKRKIPLGQRLARAIVLAVEGKDRKKSGQARPAVKYDPPPLPKGQPQRKGVKKASSAAYRGGVEMPKGNPARSGYPKKSAASRQPQRPPQRPPQRQERPVREQPQSRPQRQMSPEEKRRMEARRVHALRIRRRKKRIRNTTAAAVALLIFTILSLTVFFKIDNIIVIPGAGIVYDETQIKKVCGIEYGTVNLFRCRLSEIEERLEKGLPFIGKATVSRSFPSSLKVEAEPTVAAAAIDCGTGYLLIDKNGKMLQLVRQQPKAIVVLRCSGEFTMKLCYYISFADTSEGQTDEELLLYKDIIAAMEETKIPDITLIDIRDRQSVKLMYQNRLTLYLGTDTMLETKLATAYKTLKVEDDGSKTKTGTIDLSTIGVAYVNDTEQTTEPQNENIDG